jgi:HK97 family phage major capsid protein
MPVNSSSGTVPETKAVGDATEVALAFDGFMNAFEAFKDANDERLAQIEGSLSEDVITREKVDRISTAMDEQKRAFERMLTKSSRLGAPGSPFVSTEHKTAFDQYIRKGREDGLRMVEAKSMSASVDADGGYLVPEQTEIEIGRRLAAISPIRNLASVRTVTSSVYKKPFASSGPAVGWVAEQAARPETNQGVLSELNFPTMELYAMPAATSVLLDDAAVDIDAWIAEEVELAFAEQEGAAFVNGNGTTQPSGFMTAAQVDESAWAWGSLGTVSTGTSGDFDANEPGDALVELIYALKAGYRQNANFVMNRKVQAEVRKLKDGDGNYLWAPPATAGEAAMLMGFPVVEAEDMPDIVADGSAIAFGDFRRGYVVVDRAGVRVLRDPYSSKPYVLFYTTKRVGGGIQDFDAIKLLKFGA